MSALKWFVNSAFTQVLGLVDNGRMQESVKMLKSSKEEGISEIRVSKEAYVNGFQVPLHYPRYTKEDYEKMEGWKLDMILKEYGLSVKGTLDEKRSFAIGAFIWPN
uniref:DUF7722 domain-containing protein n=1 Tax=Fagus sylvatica TaxID=28930 RepID=A0A2N9FBF0_FAGSY